LARYLKRMKKASVERRGVERAGAGSNGGKVKENERVELKDGGVCEEKRERERERERERGERQKEK
jgi:hypothetical protein